MPLSSVCCVSQDSITVHNCRSSSPLTSAVNGARLSRPPKSLRSLYLIPKHPAQVLIWTGTKNSLNRSVFPFYRLRQKPRHCRTEPGNENELYNQEQSIPISVLTSFQFMRQVGLPTCHETEGVGSLIPLPTNVAGRHVRTSSKLGHDGLYKTTRKQYGKCKTGT